MASARPASGDSAATGRVAGDASESPPEGWAATHTANLDQPTPAQARAAHREHHHGSRDADSRLLVAALCLILALMVAEVTVAAVSGSMALFADAGHMLTDAGALAAAVWAARLARRPATGRMTWGFQRAEILSGALNGLSLVAVAAAVLVGAGERLVRPVPVDGAALVIVASAGLVVNGIATWLVARADRERLDVAGAHAHLVTDGWAFGGTLAAGVVILATGFRRADPIASLLVVGLMLRAAWPLLRSSGRILLEATPEGVDLDAVRTHLLSVPDVREVHDLHAWTLNSDLPALSAHVVVADECFAAGGAPVLLDRLQACLAGHFDVEHSTFQLEAAGHSGHEPGHHT